MVSVDDTPVHAKHEVRLKSPRRRLNVPILKDLAEAVNRAVAKVEL